MPVDHQHLLALFFFAYGRYVRQVLAIGTENGRTDVVVRRPGLAIVDDSNFFFRPGRVRDVLAVRAEHDAVSIVVSQCQLAVNQVRPAAEVFGRHVALLPQKKACWPIRRYHGPALPSRTSD